MSSDPKKDRERLGEILRRYDAAAPGSKEERKIWKEYLDALKEMKDENGLDAHAEVAK